MVLVKRVLLAGALAAMAAGACGCTPQIVGADAGVYSGGILYAVASKDMTAVYEATVSALGDLELTVTEKAKDVFSAKALAKGADGKLVSVIIRPGGDNRTEMNIKVGPVGNRHRSEVVYEQIKKRLSGAVK
jgi:hypothetical protein